MEEELKELMQKNLEVSEETLRILKKINRARVFGSIFSLIKWVIIIGISVGAYYYIEPVLKDILNNLQGMLEAVQNIKATGQSLGEIPSISPELIEKIKNLLP